ncbi:hypothetical protein [Bartonella sp. AR 15-3]
MAGLQLHAYQDVSGVWIIGSAHTEKPVSL